MRHVYTVPAARQTADKSAPLLRVPPPRLTRNAVVDIMVHHFGNDPGKLLAEAEQECGARPVVSYADL